MGLMADLLAELVAGRVVFAAVAPGAVECWGAVVWPQRLQPFLRRQFPSVALSSWEQVFRLRRETKERDTYPLRMQTTDGDRARCLRILPAPGFPYLRWEQWNLVLAVRWETIGS